MTHNYNAARDTSAYINPIELVPGSELTWIESQNLNLLSSGMTRNDVAEYRGVSVFTVMTQNKNVFRKLGASNNAHAVRLGIELGYISFMRERSPSFMPLTAIEFKVLEMASLGLTAEESAEARSVRLETVKQQRKSVIAKLEARNIVHAVRKGFEVGLFSWLDPETKLSAVQIGALLIDAKIEEIPSE